MAIYDLFILQQGIRIRDKLSHGDFQLDQLYQNYENPCHLLVLIIIDLLSYFQYKENSDNNKTLIKTNNKIKDIPEDFKIPILNYLEKYETQFHPKSFILKNTQKLLLDLYSNYHCYQQIILHNHHFFQEEDAITELKDQIPKLITSSSIALLLPQEQKDQQKEQMNSSTNPKEIIYQIFQPSFFYEQYPKKNLCSSKILNSFQESTTNLIQSCLTESSSQSFDIKNTIKSYETLITIIDFENNSSNELNDDKYKINGNVNSKF
ncbi:hypothetical protein PIROE2DRAFT_9619 [Piromyces sp. E2]|nr:hypothetical protein PIROE2DRAFT_9619 [Piromyces sp. E2]|eukprot:OUM63757.1 hypothetical protein PIROE2DRAFT_9619 [Piromyces sp. E2]